MGLTRHRASMVSCSTLRTRSPTGPTNPRSRGTPSAGAGRADRRGDLVGAAGAGEPEPGDQRGLVIGVFHHRAEIVRHRAEARLVNLDQRVCDALLAALLDRLTAPGLDDVLRIHEKLLVVG